MNIFTPYVICIMYVLTCISLAFFYLSFVSLATKNVFKIIVTAQTFLLIFPAFPISTFLFLTNGEISFSFGIYYLISK